MQRNRGAAGVDGQSIRDIEGTRHSTLTALGSVLPARILRAYSRHEDGRSLDRFVKPGPRATRHAVVKALPRRRPED